MSIICSFSSLSHWKAANNASVKKTKPKFTSEIQSLSLEDCPQSQVTSRISRLKLN